MMRITRDGDDVKVESDYGGKDHARAHSNSGVLTEYMKDQERDSIEGEDYQDIKDKLWLEDKKKSPINESNVYLRLSGLI